MIRCNFTKCLKLTIFITIIYISVMVVIHIRNRNKISKLKMESDLLKSVEIAMRISQKLKLELRKTKYELHWTEKVGHIINDSETNYQQVVSTTENIDIIQNSHKNNTITLRFWELVNHFNNDTIFTEEPTFFSNLWRQETSNLSRDEDRIVPQLIFGMDINNWYLESNQIPLKTIYLPDSFAYWGKPNWTSPHLLEKQECPGNSELFRHCSFSENPDSMKVMDAMITTKLENDFWVPAHVLKIHFRLETPAQNIARLVRSNDLLASFYRGSDINTPYGKWVYYDPAVKFKVQKKDYAIGKTKMAAIFISNCNSINRRLVFVNELQKYVDIDIYGYCGSLQCYKKDQEKCFAMLKQEYRFYLSFENTNCRDYVTEKLFVNAYQNDIIPIVLGAHQDDYKAMCPEKSYIHVEDFPNLQELANYMNYLAGNPDEYNSYFRWKGTGEFIDTHFFCRVCAMVHYAEIIPPPERKSAFRWNWKAAVKNKLCLPRRAWYWNSSGKICVTNTLPTFSIVVLIFRIISELVLVDF